MSNKFSKNSFIYTVTTIFQKGVAFFLIPVYSVYIEPNEYGIISLVLAAIAILTVFFTLSFDSAIVRFYYDFKHDHQELKRKISTLLFALAANAIGAFCLFILFGPYLFNFFLPNVDFYPYIFLGLLILVFQPFYLLVLGFCQTIENAKAYSIISIGYFLMHLLLTIVLVVVFNYGGVGILVATFVSSLIFSGIGLFYLKGFFTLAFDYKFVKQALKYTLPLIPHSIAGHLAVTLDRFLLNGYLNARITGIYYMGYQLSYPVDVIAMSYNRAFVPTYFNNVETAEGRKDIKENATVFFATCLVGAFGLSIWGPEVFKFLIDEAYQESLALLPIISFSFVATVIYYIHSCVLFYQKNKVYLVAVCTISANLLNLLLNVLLIPDYGIYGAAYATLTSQILLAFMAFAVSRKEEKVQWPTATYFLLFFLIFSLSLLANHLIQFSFLLSLCSKLVVTFMALITISGILWKSPFYIFSSILNLKAYLFKG
ncbi:MAG: oligosaccharide flippase family protein [Bacteroidetes bacterium]|nr:oligosaccharide flippase family protein [Bacteroidota bacterium]